MDLLLSLALVKELLVQAADDGGLHLWTNKL
jgi:hypothetical protein